MLKEKKLVQGFGGIQPVILPTLSNSFPKWFPDRLKIPDPSVLLNHLKNFNPDVLVSRGYNPLTLISCLMARKLGIPVMNFHQYWMGSFIKKKLLKSASILLRGIGGNDYTEVSPVLMKGRGTFIPNTSFLPFTYDKQFVRDPVKPTQTTTDNLKIITVIRIHQKRKRALFLLRTLKPFFDRYNLQLSIVGKVVNTDHPRVRKVNTWISSNNLEDDIRIIDSMEYSELQNYYREFDLFVLPSRCEPSAVTPLEAMVQGLPVICSDTNGTNGYIEHKKTGYVFETDNQNDLQSGLEFLMRDRDRLEKMGKSAFKLAQEFSPERYYERFKKILSQDLGISIR